MSNRIRGRQLLLEVGTPALNVWADTTSAVLDNEDADEDTVTFKDASEPGGAVTEYLEIAGIQSTDTESFWTWLWDHAGDEVPFTYAPHGNETPTANQPHFIGTVRIGPRPTLGGEAGRDNTYTFETRWDVIGRSTKDDGTG